VTAAIMARKKPAGEQPEVDQRVDSLRKRLGPAPAISAEDQSVRFLNAASALDSDKADEQFQAWRDEVKRKRS
jgi:hypothetical protein